MLLSVTFAPATTAPPGSVTTPFTPAEEPCAKARWVGRNRTVASVNKIDAKNVLKAWLLNLLVCMLASKLLFAPERPCYVSRGYGSPWPSAYRLLPVCRQLPRRFFCSNAGNRGECRSFGFDNENAYVIIEEEKLQTPRNGCQGFFRR